MVLRHSGRQLNAAGEQPDRSPQARPRDRLGRPLPWDAEGFAREPDDPSRPPTEALRRAQQLLDAGLPFHAHEVLEAAWKAAPEPERDLWQGLAQLAVGLTHLARGNPRGGQSLLRRGAASLVPYLSSAPSEIHHVDVAALIDWATTTAAGYPSGERAMPRLTAR